MTTTSMSLHRVIAEIKAIEQKLQSISSTPFVYVNTGESATPENAIIAKRQSQAAYDKFSSLSANLAALKSARNLANSTVKVKIAGAEMTIDEALARKAILPYKQTLVNALQHQFVAAQAKLDQNQAQVEAKINAQFQTMFAGTKKATEDEIKMIRSTFERTGRAEMVFADGLKERLEALKKEIEEFTTEVDFVLSEANATNTVNVQLV